MNRKRGILQTLLVGCVAAILWVSPAGAACSGRALLLCSEKVQLFADDVNWTHLFVLDLEPFETRVPVGLSNPALRGFWRFETAAAGARSAVEFELGYDFTDIDFESVAQVAQLPPPRVRPHGVVNRRLASAMNALMAAEQSEVLNLQALAATMNKATEASHERARSDWLHWQLAVAARYASRAAGAIGGVMRWQRTVSRLLHRRHLLMGVGSADLRLAQRQVRRHGISSEIRAQMQRLQMGDFQVRICTQAVTSTSFGPLSFSLAEILANRTTILGERGMQSALRSFARRTPPASPPPG
jgi:hypothetical protein